MVSMAWNWCSNLLKLEDMENFTFYAQESRPPSGAKVAVQGRGQSKVVGM